MCSGHPRAMDCGKDAHDLASGTAIARGDAIDSKSLYSAVLRCDAAVVPGARGLPRLVPVHAASR